MSFKGSVTLSSYSDAANKQFNDIQSRLTKIESNFQARMNGKTTGRLVGSLIGTLCWLAAFIVGAFFVRDMVHSIVFIIAMVAIFGLMAFMLIDNLISFSYYGKISIYKNSISKLSARVSSGKASVRSKQAAFLASEKKGWHYPLTPSSSIPEEATAIESKMSNLESLKSGFISGAKNVFYYAAIVMFTVTVGLALFPIVREIMTGISKEQLPETTTTILSIIALAVICIVEIILAKLVWSKTDCSVTNKTLFIILVGPVAFPALIALATLLVMLVLLIAKVVFHIIGIVVVLALAYSCCCGG